MTSAYQVAMRFSSFAIVSVTLCSLVSAFVRSTNTPLKSHMKADNYVDPKKVLVFNCDGKIFSSRRIRSAARSACKVIRKKNRSFWNPNNLNLKVYESSVKVDTIGDTNIVSVDNTFSWPIKSGIYRLLPAKKGRYRIILNIRCRVLNLMYIKKGQYKACSLKTLSPKT